MELLRQAAGSPTTLELALPACIHTNQMKQMGVWDQIRPQWGSRNTALPKDWWVEPYWGFLLSVKHHVTTDIKLKLAG